MLAGELLVRVAADISSFVSGMSRVRAEADEMSVAVERASERSSSGLSGLVGHMVGGAKSALAFASQVGFAAMGIKALGEAAIGMGMAMIKPNADMEQLQIAFTGLLHSSSAAHDMLRKLQQFAAATPFEFPELVEDSKMMLALGFSAQQIIPMLTAVGDAAAGLGVGQEGIQRIILALGQMHAHGVVDAQDMMQLTQVGINGWQILADHMHKTIPEVQKLSSQGLIPADQAINYLIDGMERAFGGQMQNQSMTFNGLMSTLADNIRMAWMNMSGPIFEQAKRALVFLVNLVSSNAFANFSREVGDKVAVAMKLLASHVSGIIPLFHSLFEAVGAFVHSMAFREVVAAFAGVVGLLAARIRELWGRVLEVAGQIRQWAAHTQTLSTVGMSLAGVISTLVNLAGLFLGGTIGLIAKIIEWAVRSGTLTNILNALTFILSGLSNIVTHVIEPVNEIITKFAQWLFQSNVLQPVLDGIGKVIGAIADALSKIMPGIVGLVNQITQTNTKTSELTPKLSGLQIVLQVLGDILSNRVAPLIKMAGDFLDGFIRQAEKNGAIKNLGDILAHLGDTVGHLFDVGSKLLSDFLAPFGIKADHAKGAGQGVADAVGAITGAINGVMDKLNSFAKLLDDSSDAGTALRAALGGVVGALLVIKAIQIVQVIVGLVGAFVGWAGAAAGAAAATWAAVAPLLPIIAIIALVVAAIIGLILVITHWSQVLGFLQHVWNTVVSALQAGAGWLRDRLAEIWNAIVAKISEVWQHIVVWLQEKAAQIVNTVSTKFHEMVNAVSQKVQEIQQAISNKWNEITTWIANKLNEIKNAIVNKWNEIVTAVSNKFNEIKNAVMGKFDEIKNAVTQKVNDIVNGIKDFGGKVLDVILMPFKAIGKLFGPIAAQLGAFFAQLSKVLLEIIAALLAKAWQWVADKLKPVVDGLVGLWNWLKDKAAMLWGAITGAIQAKVAEVRDWLIGAWNGIRQKAAELWGAVSGAIQAKVREVSDWLIGAWNGIKDKAAQAWDWIKDRVGDATKWIHDNIISNIQKAWDWLTGKINDLKNWLGARWEDIKRGAEEKWNAVKDAIGDAMGKAKDFVQDKWSAASSWLKGVWEEDKREAGIVFNWIKNTISDRFNEAKRTVQDIWTAISNFVGDKLNALKKIIGDWGNSIKNSISDALNQVKKTFIDIWNGIKQTSLNVINGFLGGISAFLNAIADGVNTVAGWLGVKDRVGHVNLRLDVRAYEGGTPPGGHPGGLAMVGERGPELVWLPPGAHVFTNSMTNDLLALSRLFAATGVPGYEGGTSGIGAFFSAVTGAVQGIANFTRQVASDAMSFISDLFSGGLDAAVTHFLEKFGVHMPSLPPVISSWVSAIWDRILGYIRGFLHSINPAASVVQTGGGAGGSFGATPVNVPGDVRAWILQAMRITGVPANWLGPLITIAMHESGGDPNVVNNWDINAQRGDPSRGLFQTIGATFAAYALPGHMNIFNPVDNAIAAIRYIIARYGDVFHVPGIVSMAHGGPYVGYAAGGLLAEPVAGLGLSSGRRYLFGERGPEWVIPAGCMIGTAAHAGPPINITVELDGRVIAQASLPHVVREIRLKSGLR